MMKYLSSLLLFLATALAPGHSSAQEKWVSANGDAIAFGHPATMVALPNGTVFFGCDEDHSGIFKSEDYGQSFKKLSFNDWCYALVADSKGTLYAGGNYGLTRSTNNGEKWTNVSSARTKITALAVGNDQGIYAATGSAVHRSIDGGETWAAADIKGVVALLATPNAVYAGTLFGFYRSTDKGATWTLVKSIDNKYPYDVLTRDAHGTLYACGIGGIYLSSNEGASWTPRNSLGKNLYALSADSSDNLYAATSDGIYRTMDDGRSWQKLSGKDSSFRPYTSCIANDGGANLYVGVSSSSDFAYVSRSTDRGDSWPLPPDRGIAISRVLHLFVDKDQALYASTDRGLYRSVTKGKSWERLSTKTNDAFNMCSALSDGTLFALGTYSGPYRSSDHGQTWTVHDKGLPLDTLAGKTIRDLRGFAETADGSLFLIDARESYKGTGGSLFRSRDNGESWDSVSSLRNFLTGRGVFQNLIAHGNYLFLGVNGAQYQGVDTFAVYFSSDFGENWTPCGQPTWKYDATVCFNPYTGYLMAGRLRSVDNGDSWISRSAEQPGVPFVVGPGYIYCTSLDRSYDHYASRSTDDGESWTTVKIDSLPASSPSNFLSMAMDSSGTVFGGTLNDGVYRRVGAVLSANGKGSVTHERSVEIVHGYLQLEANGSTVEIEIYDALGRRHVCPTTRTSTGWQVDVRRCVRGLYFAMLNGSSKGFFVQ